MARNSLPARNPLTSRGPNLRTADRSFRRKGSVSSLNSANGLNQVSPTDISNINNLNSHATNNVLGISEATLAQFEENILYEAQEGNNLDE